MDIELSEILDTLCEYAPFADLKDEPILQEMVKDIEIQYLRAGQWAIAPEERNETLFFIRSGAVESKGREGKLL